MTAALGFCTFEYRPVCSKNSNNECKTDPNFCAYKLKADTDEPSEFWFVWDYESRKILIAKQYSDAGWDLVSFDACPDQEQCPPGFACDTAGACAPGVYNSVCASDNGEFRYYENFCEYQVAKCSNPSKISIGYIDVI